MTIHSTEKTKDKKLSHAIWDNKLVKSLRDWFIKVYAFKYLNLNMHYLSLTVLLAWISPKETDKYKNIENRYFFHPVVKRAKQTNQ